MKIDRAQFFLFVSAIAGCGAPSSASTPSTARSAATGSTTSASPASATATPTTAPTGATTAIATAPTHASAEGHDAPVYPSSEGDPPSGGPVMSKSKWTSSAAPTCAAADDAVGQPKTCTALKIDKSCAPFPFLNGECVAATQNFKPRVAETATDCIRSISPIALCDAMHTYDCLDAALMRGCPDPTADAACKRMTQVCPQAKLSDCRRYLSGMNATGRDAMVKCMSDPDYCSYGLHSCVEGL